MGHDAALEQPDIAGQQDAALVGGQPRQFRVVVVVAVERVEAQHPQVGRQPAQMRVEDEAEADRRRTQRRRRGRERDRGGEDLDLVARPDLVAEIDRGAVY